MKSPDGKLEFRLFTALPEGSILNCLAYQLWQGGKPVMDTSYLGLDVQFQEPLLGENVGLSAERPLHERRYNGLWADYLQTSTTGRRIQFEVRVYNGGAAFRYIVPKSALLFDLPLADEITQFRFASAAYRSESAKLPETTGVPYLREAPDGTWVGLYTQQMPGFPNLQLKRLDTRTLVTHLPVSGAHAGYETKTPWTGPWRIILVGNDRDALAQSEILRDFQR